MHPFQTGGKPADEGVVSKLGLNDWKFALPIAMLVGIPAISNEVIVVSMLPNETNDDREH